MIVDTSALIAIVQGEPGHEDLDQALRDGRAVFPAPVLVEFDRVSARRGPEFHAIASELLSEWLAIGISVAPLDTASAESAMAANLRYGAGNAKGGRLNLLDLMVYGIAKTINQPILCTGTDFASTDAELHPASRRW